MARLDSNTISAIWKASFRLIAFVNGDLKPRESDLDEWQDILVCLLEAVHDASFPDALTPEGESSEEPADG